MDKVVTHKSESRKFKCKVGRELAGYLQYEYPTDAGLNRNIVLSWVFVKPKFRRQGIASLLIQHFLKFAQKYTWMSLWTGKQMEIDKSWGLYNSLGFTQLAIQEDYYAKGIPTRLFVKRISSD